MQDQQSTVKERQFPWKHIIGFLLSIVLTIIALLIALYSNFSVRTIVILIFSLAFVQAALQLLMFMHMTESSNGKIQAGNMLFAAFIAIVIALGSYWVMEFGIHLEHHM